jgi:hypothetical protein
MFGEIDPSSVWVDRAMSSPQFDLGREGQARDGEADHLALTAAKAADRVTHEKDMTEVVSA